MSSSIFIQTLASPRPSAVAILQGDTAVPVRGYAEFYRTYTSGIVVQVEIMNLPDSEYPGQSGFFGMHIHETGNCTPPFNRTGMHYNPTDQPHPFHSGDLPPLLSNHGYAWMAFYDTRFTIPDVIGRSLIIHQGRDDFTTQPSGDSGNKIACGIIELYVP